MGGSREKDSSSTLGQSLLACSLQAGEWGRGATADSTISIVASAVVWPQSLSTSGPLRYACNCLRHGWR